MAISKLVSMLGLMAVVASTFLVESAAAESKVRIVRLSDVEGAVQIERAPGEGLEKAFLNLPIIQGSIVKTGHDGRAEVEFEDGSAARIGPDSELTFTHLSLGDNGEKLNTMRLKWGTFYGSFHAKNGDEYQLNFAQESVSIAQNARYRVMIGDPHAVTVAVFKGKVEATGPTGKIQIPEKHTAKIDLAVTDATKKDAIVVAKNYDEDALDGWDRRQNDYHERYASAGGGSAFSSPYGYGVSDLNYYGTFATIPGYGYAWQPFFANAGWNPFTDGAWAFYPGSGYMWVSGYPWGWMPYYYGTWANAPGYGWVWQPGSWNSWSAVPRIAAGSSVMPTAPASGNQTVMVGRGLMANASELPAKLTINPGSAGFGVPRGSLNRLDHYSRTIDRNLRPLSVATERPVEVRGGGFGMEPGLRGSSPGGFHGSAPSSSSPSTPASHSAPAQAAGPHK